MDSYITFQFTRSNALLDIWPLVVSKSFACVFTMWYLTTFEIKHNILRVTIMQC